MFDCPPQSHTSPTTTSCNAIVFFPVTTKSRPSSLAASGGRYMIQRPSRSAVAKVVWPANATIIFWPEAFHFTDVLDARRAQPVDAAEVREQRAATHRAETREIVENALANFLRLQGGVVGVGEPVRLVAQPLQEIQRRRIERKIQGRALVGKDDRLVFL